MCRGARRSLGAEAGKAGSTPKSLKATEEKVVAAAAAVQPDDVLVPREVAAEFFAHLRSQGRTDSFTSPDDAHAKLGALVAREWAGTRCKRFKDRYGGGWLIDLSDFVDGEALHAIVRTTLGRRTVMTVVEEEEIENFSSTGDWTNPAAKTTAPPGVDAAVLEAAAAIETGKGRRQASSAPPPSAAVAAPTSAQSMNDPVLVLVVSLVKEGHDPEIVHSVRCTREEVPGVVKMLLRSGHAGEPVTEEQIEVWGSVSKPRLEVRF